MSCVLLLVHHVTISSLAPHSLDRIKAAILSDSDLFAFCSLMQGDIIFTDTEVHINRRRKTFSVLRKTCDTVMHASKVTSVESVK